MLSEVTSLDAYLERYGQLLAEQTERAFKPLHVPATQRPVKLNLKRPLFDSQAHCVTAIAKAWKTQKSLIFVGEMGVGKSFMGIAAAHAHAAGKPYRALVFCPDHLQRKWAREIRDSLPGHPIIVILDDWKLVTLFRKGIKPTGAEWYIIGRNKAKFSANWRAAYLETKRHGALLCPNCGEKLMKDKVEILPESTLRRLKSKCPVCQGALWQHTHQLDRWAPCQYIHKKLKGYFDYLIADEVHEEKSETSIQGQALGSLAAACKKVLALTGTLIGGYANHVRPILFRLCPKSLLEDGLGWEDSMAFLREYGRIETTVTEKSGGMESSMKMGRGKKPTKTERPRPGIMPTLYGRHLLGSTVFLSLEECAAGLPKCPDLPVPIKLEGALATHYKTVEEALRNELKSMMANGKWGQMRKLLAPMLQTLLCYPDYPFDWKEVGYTDTSGGGEEWVSVVQPPNLNPANINPKERELVKIVREEVRAGRQVWVYVVFTQKHPVGTRLVEILNREGFRAKALPSSVPLKDREKWIEANAPDMDVIISHPKLVETGLDLFCKAGKYNFPTLIFYETGYNLFTLRQASRRSWRIGQRRDCKVYYLYYEKTMQEQAMGLMGKKLTASLSLEGKFTSESMAALAGDEGSVEMELAKALSEKIDFQTERTWGKVKMLEQEPDAPATQQFATVDPWDWIDDEVAALLGAAASPIKQAEMQHAPVQDDPWAWMDQEVAELEAAL